MSSNPIPLHTNYGFSKSYKILNVYICLKSVHLTTIDNNDNKL